MIWLSDLDFHEYISNTILVLFVWKWQLLNILAPNSEPTQQFHPFTRVCGTGAWAPSPDFKLMTNRNVQNRFETFKRLWLGIQICVLLNPNPISSISPPSTKLTGTLDTAHAFLKIWTTCMAVPIYMQTLCQKQLPSFEPWQMWDRFVFPAESY